MEILSLIGIILALALLVYMITKGYSLILVSFLAALVVALTGQLNLAEALGTTFVGGVAKFITQLFPLFFGGQILGKVLEVSGLSNSISHSVATRLGAKNVVLAAFVATYIMALIGISTYIIIFTVYPMCLALFKGTPVSRALIPAIVLGGVASAQMLPGIPIAANIIPAEYLGVTAMAAPITAIVGAIIVTGLNLWYLIHEANKCIARGDKFELLEGETGVNDIDVKNLPSVWLAVISFAVIIILLNVVKWPAWAALIAGAVVLMALTWNRLGDKKQLLNAAAKNTTSVLNVAAITGFGAVVTAAPGYSFIAKFLETTSAGNPYLYAGIAVSIIAAVTGSATGSLRLILDSSAAKMLEMGADPAALSRIFTMTSFGMDSLPWTGAIVLTLESCHVSHKDGYKHLFVTTVVTNMIALAVGIVMVSLGIR